MATILRSSGVAIIVTNPDGGGETIAVNDCCQGAVPAQWIHPSFSPDGRQIVYAGQHKADPKASIQLYIVNVDGTGDRRFSPQASGDYDPAWSPDGTHIDWYPAGPT